MTGKLLILDDDRALAETIALMAESAGVEARVTVSPEAFFRVYGEWEPSHIALDLIMPEMDGVQVLNRLAELDCTAGIVISSGVGRRVLDAAARSASEHGLKMLGLLPKPFSPSDLRTLLLGSPASKSASRPIRKTGARELTEAPTVEELQAALDADEISIVYQPQIACSTGRVTGFEALARWQHPERGTVPPDRFIRLAEESGLIDHLTDRVLELGLAWFKDNVVSCCDFRAAELPTLSINISALSLADRDFAEDALQACRRHGVDASRVVLEVTETAAMRDPVAALDQLTRTRMKGFQLSLDDFGTGFSSILQLARLPFSEIKIDKSFVMSAMQSAETRAVVRTVVDLGRSLGLRIVAEGVENPATLEFLCTVGCEHAQGFYISRPLPPSELAGWLELHLRPQPVEGSSVAYRSGSRQRSVVFDWSKDYLTGLDGVDDQHRRLVAILNAFGGLMEEAEEIDGQRLDELFSELQHYAAEHFRYEEGMMTAAGIDPRHRGAHGREHAFFLGEVLQLREIVDIKDSQSLEPVVDFLINWLAYHILGVDQSMARQIRAIEQGADPARAYKRDRDGSPDSVQPLVRALRSLFHLLSDRSRELRETNKRLEHRVAERTAALSEANRQLEAMAMTDTLTGIANRRQAMIALNREWHQASAVSEVLACLMVDVDGLKPVNDHYGHEAGDDVIKAVATCLRHHLRTDDLVARMGGDEFLIIARVPDADSAHRLGETVLKSVIALQVPTGESHWSGGVSIGVAMRTSGMQEPEALLRASDEALYAAKQAGRSRIMLAKGS